MFYRSHTPPPPLGDFVERLWPGGAFPFLGALARKTADWARIAVDCGYFDQSHLIRDFLEFSGLTPADYLRRQSGQVLPNHVPQGG